MEYNQTLVKQKCAGLSLCLNPCFNGTFIRLSSNLLKRCLNPCFSGIQSNNKEETPEEPETRLNPCFSGIQSN